MNRVRLSFIVLVVMLATACAGGDGVSPAPTAPSPTPPAPAPPPTTPPPSTSCAPGPATNLTVSTVGTNRTLSWTAGTNAVDYTVTIGTASGATDLVNTNTTKTTFAWNEASPGTYYSRVHSRNACGGGAPSNELVFN